jgi:Glycosyl transferases group 1
LHRAHDWRGAIVLAGPHVDHGSSLDDENEIRVQRSIRPELVIAMSAVSDSERSWLMRRAAAIVYPTVHEGFGLVPFEAAAFGVPCLFAPQSSLGELFDSELAALVPWDPVRSAARVVPLLSDSPERARHVDSLRQTATALRWADCARATVDAYGKTLATPSRESREGAWQALEREHEIVLLDRNVHDLQATVHNLQARVVTLTDDLGPDALALVGPRALLSRADQHALLAVAARPVLRRLLLGGLRRAYRAMRTVRSLGDRTSDPTWSRVDGRR